jgi:hypothetical protein
MLEAHPVLERPQVVADVEISGRLNAGQNSGFHAEVKMKGSYYRKGRAWTK